MLIAEVYSEISILYNPSQSHLEHLSLYMQKRLSQSVAVFGKVILGDHWGILGQSKIFMVLNAFLLPFLR